MINQAVGALHLLKKTDDQNEENEDVLEKTEKLVKIFRQITFYIRNQEKKELFSILLKTGRTFIEQFTIHSIPYFTEIFKYHNQKVAAILRDFQKCTRIFQVKCYFINNVLCIWSIDMNIWKRHD